MVSIIVAIAENYAIGKQGGLLCHLPADLQHFKQITQGHTVIMGERTYLSLPKHPLPNRKNIVISDNPAFNDPQAIVVRSIPEALRHVNTDEEAFIIGGGMVTKPMNVTPILIPTRSTCARLNRRTRKYTEKHGIHCSVKIRENPCSTNNGTVIATVGENTKISEL